MNKEKIKALFSRKAAAEKRAAKKAEMKWLTLNQTNWNIVCVFLLLVSVIWHLEQTIGWLNGDTLINLYRVNALLAGDIAESPDMLFFSTYFAFVISLGCTVFVGYMIFRALFEKDSAQDALTPVLWVSAVTPWVFPTIFIIADIAATAMKVRSTMMFDVFQLGIDMFSLIIVSVCSLALVWLNKNIDNL